MTDHLDLDALADALADIALTGSAADHLASCPTCQARSRELGTAMSAVSADLASLAPPPVPAELPTRIAAAVQAERTTPVVGDVLPLQTAGRRGRWLPILGGIAAAAVVATGVVVLTQGHGHTTATRATGSSTYHVADTGTDYTPTTLASALPALLSGSARSSEATQSLSAGAARPAVPNTTSTSAAASSDPLVALRDTAGLARCLASLTDPSDNGLPLALDYAAYEGKPALVVVLPSSKPGKVDVFVVPAGCARADGSLLYFTRLAKP